MNTREQYMHLLSEFQNKKGNAYGIKRMGILGSVARGEQSEKSDIDIYYEGEALSMFRLAVLKDELENILENSVDIVRLRESMNQLLRKRINKDGLYV